MLERRRLHHRQRWTPTRVACGAWRLTRRFTVFTRSPSRLAATVSFDSVSPEPAIPCDGGADALDLAGARRDPGLDRLRAGRAVADHLGGEAALRLRRSSRARGRARGGRNNRVTWISRAALDDAVELEERAGREIGRRDVGTGLPVRSATEHDVGRGGERRQARDPARELLRHAGAASARRRAPRSAFAASCRQHAIERAPRPPRCRRDSARPPRRGPSTTSTLRTNHTMRSSSRSCTAA